MTQAVLRRLCHIIQKDVGHRGLQFDPQVNLINAFPDDFALACQSLAKEANPVMVIVTGFFIPTGQPPAGETDGPLGALFLARALTPLNIPVAIATDDFCLASLQAGLAAAGLANQVPLISLSAVMASTVDSKPDWQALESAIRLGPITHLLAVERAGPSHNLASFERQYPLASASLKRKFLEVVPPDHQDRCHTMRGRDITAFMSPSHRLFEEAARQGVATLGIGDGGNEIGMGKLPWETICRNIPNGGLVACRVSTDFLLVCGISNWGAYALATGIAVVRNYQLPETLFDPDLEQALLQTMVDHGPLVDGVTGKPTATVDGLTFPEYIQVLREVNRARKGGFA